jgi:hypothetical protein
MRRVGVGTCQRECPPAVGQAPSVATINGFTASAGNYYQSAATDGPVGANAFTIALIIRPTTSSIGAHHTILYRFSNNYSGYRLFMNATTNVLQWQGVDSGPTTRTSNSVALTTTDALSLVFLRWDGTANTMDMRVNSTDVTQVTTPSGWASNTSALSYAFGSRPGGTFPCTQIEFYGLGESTTRLSDAQLDTWASSIQSAASMTSAPASASFVYTGDNPNASESWVPTLGTGTLTETGTVTGVSHDAVWVS